MLGIAESQPTNQCPPIVASTTGCAYTPAQLAHVADSSTPITPLPNSSPSQMIPTSLTLSQVPQQTQVPSAALRQPSVSNPVIAGLSAKQFAGFTTDTSAATASAANMEQPHPRDFPPLLLISQPRDHQPCHAKVRVVAIGAGTDLS